MGVQSLDRAIDILELLASDENGRSVGAVAAELGLHKSTASRLIRSLAERGYVEVDRATGLYRVGLGLVELAGSYLGHLELRVEARPAMYDLAERCGHTVFLAVLQDCEVVYIDKTEFFGSLRRYSIIGARAPVYSTSLGKALLMYLGSDELDHVLDRLDYRGNTTNTLRSREALKADLERSRRRGFTLDLEENEDNVRCVGAAVRDYRGYPAAALSISGQSERLPDERLEELGQMVRGTAERISRSIGYVTGKSRRAASGENT